MNKHEHQTRKRAQVDACKGKSYFWIELENGLDQGTMYSRPNTGCLVELKREGAKEKRQRIALGSTCQCATESMLFGYALQDMLPQHIFSFA